MISFLANYQLLNLSGLWLALLGPILILAYLYQGRFSKDKIASLMILRSLPKKTVIKQKIKLPLRYFLELATLLALTLALAELSKIDQNDRAIFILDNSLSMQAQTKNNFNRFDLAVKRLEETLKQNSFSKVSLYITTPRLMVLANNESPRAILELLPTLKPSYLPDQLANELPELMKTANYKKLFLFTDQKFNFALADSEKVTPFLINEPAGNIFFSSASLHKFAQDRQQILARVQYDKSTHADISFSVKLFSLDKEAPELLTSQKAVIAANTGYGDIIIDLDNSNLHNAYRLELVAADSLEDAISADNNAYVSADISSQLNLLLVSNEPFKSGLEQLSTIKLTVKTRADLENTPELNANAYDLIIFYKLAPLTPPQIPALLILPPENNIFPLTANDQANPVVTSWLEAHPLMRYLRVALLKPALVNTFQSLPWATGVINTEQGHIFMAGESHGLRLAAIGFEIFPFEGAKTPLSTTLFLNTLNWLSQADLTNSYGLTGSVFKPQLNSDYSILAPSKKAADLLDAKQPYSFAQPGIYRIHDLKTGNKTTQAINAFYLQESAISEISTSSIPPLGPLKTDNAVPVEKNDFVSYFLLGALMLLMLETLSFLKYSGEKR